MRGNGADAAGQEGSPNDAALRDGVPPKPGERTPVAPGTTTRRVAAPEETVTDALIPVTAVEARAAERARAVRASPQVAPQPAYTWPQPQSPAYASPVPPVAAISPTYQTSAASVAYAHAAVVAHPVVYAQPAPGYAPGQYGHPQQYASQGYYTPMQLKQEWTRPQRRAALWGSYVAQLLIMLGLHVALYGLAIMAIGALAGDTGIGEAGLADAQGWTGFVAYWVHPQNVVFFSILLGIIVLALCAGGWWIAVAWQRARRIAKPHAAVGWTLLIMFALFIIFVAPLHTVVMPVVAILAFALGGGGLASVWTAVFLGMAISAIVLAFVGMPIQRGFLLSSRPVRDLAAEAAAREAAARAADEAELAATPYAARSL